MIEEIKCDECNGEGFYFEMGTDLYGNSKSQLRSCKKCKHTGKVNWIENVFGKQNTRRDEIKEKLKKIVNMVDSSLIDMDSSSPMVDYLINLNIGKNE